MISFACQDIEFKDLLRCSFQMNKTEYNVMVHLLRTDEAYTAEQIGEQIGLDRTTVQKAIKKLAEKEIVLRLQTNLEKGGYMFIYRIKNKDELKQRMLNIVEKWIDEVKNQISNW